MEHSSPTFAKLQVQRFFDKVKLLESHPLLGRVVPEVNRFHFREIITDRSYRIIYRVIDSEALGIITVHHTSRPLRTTILGVDMEPVQFLVQNTSILTKELLFLITGSSNSTKVSTGMIIKHKNHEFSIHDIQVLVLDRDNYITTVALVIKCRDEEEKHFLKAVFEKGQIIEIY